MSASLSPTGFLTGAFKNNLWIIILSYLGEFWIFRKKEFLKFWQLKPKMTFLSGSKYSNHLPIKISKKFIKIQNFETASNCFGSVKTDRGQNGSFVSQKWLLITTSKTFWIYSLIHITYDLIGYSHLLI